MVNTKVFYLLLITILHSLAVEGQPDGQVIYFTDASYNYIFRLANNKVDTIISSGLGFPWRITTDVASIYWTSVDKNLIEKANLDGSNRQELAVITYPEGIAVNSQSGDIYVSEAGTPAILKLRPPDYRPDTLYLDGLTDPDNILYSAINDKLYWVDVATGEIIEANPDGSGMKTLLANSDYEPQAITIDNKAEYIYWADTKKNGIGILNIATRESELLITNLAKPTAITIDRGSHVLFWLDVGTKTISWKILGEPEIHNLRVKQISDFHSGFLVMSEPKR